MLHVWSEEHPLEKENEWWQKRSWVSLLMVIQWFRPEPPHQVLKCWISGWDRGTVAGWVPWVVEVSVLQRAWPDFGVSGPSAGSPRWYSRAGWFGRSECPSCPELMTIWYKKGSRGGIQSDSLHSGSSHQLRAFFLMKVCFCTVNDLWQGLKCIALTMPTHFEHSK